VILDFQVHASVQTAAQLLKARGIPIHLVHHNNTAELERKIQNLKSKHEKIWYLADGVYSMHGDFAPLDQLAELLDSYEQFYMYIDDAHGMSWTGDNGRGFVRSIIPHHDKMVLAVSLNKAFATAGGALVFPDFESARRVRNCGGTYIFSGPVQPPMLGAALASAGLHLSGEIETYQEELRDLIQYMNLRLNEYNIPQVKETDSPLFFIPLGSRDVTNSFVQRMQEDGFYVNLGSFPAVPMSRGGMRFTINRNLKKEDIDLIAEAIRRNYPATLAEEGVDFEKVARTFKIPAFKIKGFEETELPARKKNDFNLTLEIKRTVSDLNAKEWDEIFAGRGNITYSSLELLERVFSEEKDPENHWEFFYVLIRNSDSKIILATFYTCSLLKDDMFAPESVSRKLEVMRREEPYLFSSMAVMLGCPITKGEHLYLDRKSAEWKEALRLLTENMEETASLYEAPQIMLREFPMDNDDDLKNAMLDRGLIEYRLPDNCRLEDLSWRDHDEYLRRLGGKYRYNVRREILDFLPRFVLKTEKPMTEHEIVSCYELYRQVHERAFEMNVFCLPFSFFEAICAHPSYDVLRLYLKDDPRAESERKPVAVMYSFTGGGLYSALIVGLDYEYLKTNNIYKQMLYQTVQRAWSLKCRALDLAFTAVLEKKKVGARPRPTCAYLQSMDLFSQAVLESMSRGG